MLHAVLAQMIMLTGTSKEKYGPYNQEGVSVLAGHLLGDGYGEKSIWLAAQHILTKADCSTSVHNNTMFEKGLCSCCLSLP